MSSPLRKKNPTFAFVGEKFNKDKVHEDKIICLAADKATFALYLVLKDEYGFGPRKLQNFYDAIVEYKKSWRDGATGSLEMVQKCKKKGFPVDEFLKKIPSQKKLALIKPFKLQNAGAADTVNTVSSALRLVIMMSTIILNEKYKMSVENIKNVMDRTRSHIDCMTTLQPGTKKPYVTMEDIINHFREDVGLDLVSGKRWKEGAAV